MKKIKRINHFLSNLVYPRRCPLCDRILKNNEKYICFKCVDDFKFISDRTCVRCGVVLKSRFEHICPECQNSGHVFDEALAPFVYTDKIRESIVRYKYRGRAEYAGFYAACIWKFGKKRIKSWNPDVIIPVPVHMSRLYKRGYNQAEILANELSKVSGIPVDNSFIFRKKKTKAQKELNSAQRRNNLIEAFCFVQNDHVPETVLIADDIFTTGSTADAISYILRLNGVKNIYVVCIATS